MPKIIHREFVFYPKKERKMGKMGKEGRREGREGGREGGRKKSSAVSQLPLEGHMMLSRNMVEGHTCLSPRRLQLAKEDRNVDLQLTACAENGLGMGMTIQNC